MKQPPPLGQLVRRVAASAVMTLAAATACLAAQPDFAQAYDMFRRAAVGDAGADNADSAAEAFAGLLKAQPDNPLLMAYFGASTSMRARGALLPWTKLQYAEDGLASIDKALALASAGKAVPALHGTPGVLELKFVAATTMLAVPGFMNRGAQGARLLAEVQDSPAFAASPQGFRGEVLWHAAELAIAQKRLVDARRLLNDIITQNAPQADAAKSRLKELAS
jgi:hypothetical protein